jgi:hypothetical protein
MAKPNDKAAPKQEEAPAASSASAAAPVSESLPPTAPDPGVTKARPAEQVARFRVWPHGALSHDGTVYQAGEELAFTEAEVAALNCPAIERF